MEIARYRVGNPDSKVAKMSEKTKVLVVDDEEIVCRSYLRSLAGARCNVQVAENGEQALYVLGQQRFDLVLLDLRMPGMDGMAVLRTIKQNWPETQVVIITGYPSIETAKEAVRLGAYGYLAKPVGPIEVINAANDAVMLKKWTLHSDRAGQDMAAGPRTGSRVSADRLAC
jgi:DNA-binding NtrC family response regulator